MQIFRNVTIEIRRDVVILLWYKILLLILQSCKSWYVSRFHSYLNTATTIIRRYDGAEPFASMVKKFFSAQKKYGSKDRKQISHLCYCYFRTGKIFFTATTNTLETHIITALFLCTTEHNEMLSAIAPELEAFTSVPCRRRTQRCLRTVASWPIPIAGNQRFQ